MNISFQARCPNCKKTVTAAILRGSLEKLQADEGDVEVGHPTDDPHVGDHTWKLDPQSIDNLRKKIAEGFFGR
jgi:hypothetical protein